MSTDHWRHVQQESELTVVFADHCPTDNGFSVQAGRCVDVRDTRITWHDAQQECETHAGHLYVGNTADDMAAVKIAIQNLGKSDSIKSVSYV